MDAVNRFYAFSVRSNQDAFDSAGIGRFSAKESRRFPGVGNTFLVRSETRQATIRAFGADDLIYLDGSASDYQVRVRGKQL